MKSVHDPLTNDMFIMTQPEHLEPGHSDFALEVSRLVSEVMKNCKIDRHEISAQMSRLLGKNISVNILNAWASPGRTEHNIPQYLVPIFEYVCDSYELTDWLAKKRGGSVAYGKDALNAELGKLERLKAESTQQIRELKKMMSEWK